MKRILLAACFLFVAARVEAQPAPTIVSTLQTTNTSSTSLQVGCAIGSAVCTGGIVAGPIIGSALGAESGYVEIQSNVPASQTFRLVNNSGTLQWNGSPLAIGGSISGTTNTVPLFTASNAVGNSIMTQSGTTITVANTLSATTLTGTLSTVSQPNVTTMAALASIGTITTGVWNGTAVGLQWGGTNANLSGTGGPSQFLRQNSVGAAITVVRPAVADLSDNSNVALLNANNTFTATGTQTIGSGGTGATAYDIFINGGSASSGGAFIAFQRNSVTQSTIGTESAILGTNSNNLALRASTSAGIDFFTNAVTSPNWGINSAGDFTFGASSHIADSSGTPSITAGGGTGPSIAGTDYAMTITIGTAPGASVTVGFGHTWSTAPACVVSALGPTVPVAPGSITTTQIQMGPTSGNFTANGTVWVLCRGF